MLTLSELTQLLNDKLLKSYNTKLVGGFNEPFYQAAKNGQMAEIQFSHDYIRSALHELAHWCVAGVERRKIDDYGYWYATDGRTQAQQNEFFHVEIKPQALEWEFCRALGIGFEASLDNLNNSVEGIEPFKQSLNNQLQLYTHNGFPKRASKIFNLLKTLSKD